MNTPNTNFSSGQSLFGNFQTGVARQPPPSAIPVEPPQPYTEPPLPQQHLNVSSLSPPLAEIAALPSSPSLQRRSCPSCRGVKYDFTSYFHNKKTFLRPPHEIIKVIEKSYTLNNVLESLVYNYVHRGNREESPEDIRTALQAWEARVNNLAVALGDEALVSLGSWARVTMQQVCDHVAGTRKMELPLGGARELSSEFRKLWEDVWVGYVSRRDVAMMVAPSLN